MGLRVRALTQKDDDKLSLAGILYQSLLSLVPPFPFCKLSFCHVLVGYFLCLLVVVSFEKSLLLLCFLWVMRGEVSQRFSESSPTAVKCPRVL